MAITVAPGSARIAVTQRPAVQAPAPNLGNGVMRFTCQAFQFRGDTDLTGGAGDAPAGWLLGSIQCEWVETNWGYYRGERDDHGSLFVQRARPPARPQQACRDTLLAGSILVDNLHGAERFLVPPGAALPVHMTCQFSDAPSESFQLQLPNPRTHQPNFLHEAQLEFHFCTVLTLISPTGTFHHLKHIYWNVHWQARFTPPHGPAPWGVHLVGQGMSAAVGHVNDGAPHDRRFVGVLTANGAPNCNLVAANASQHPIIRPSNRWENFDVTR
jgi:hypothetical protein